MAAATIDTPTTRTQFRRQFRRDLQRLRRKIEKRMEVELAAGLLDGRMKEGQPNITEQIMHELLIQGFSGEGEPRELMAV
jgi:AmiR/NasT family two-component response regulator